MLDESHCVFASGRNGEDVVLEGMLEEIIGQVDLEVREQEEESAFLNEPLVANDVPSDDEADAKVEDEPCNMLASPCELPPLSEEDLLLFSGDPRSVLPRSKIAWQVQPNGAFVLWKVDSDGNRSVKLGQTNWLFGTQCRCHCSLHSGCGFVVRTHMRTDWRRAQAAFDRFYVVSAMYNNECSDSAAAHHRAYAKVLQDFCKSSVLPEPPSGAGAC